MLINPRRDTSFTTPPHPFFNSPCYACRMEPSWTHQPEITLSEPFGAGERAVFALAGFVVVVVALGQAQDALPLPVFATITSLCSMVLTFVLLNAFGQSEVWTLRERELVLSRRSPWLLNTTRFRARDVAATAIVKKMEKGADGTRREQFRLVMVSKAGRSYPLPAMESPVKAQEFDAELRARLGLPSH
jgi:hypothetical protein